jgi:hypothetical protein
LCKRLHIHAICLRAHIIKHMIISVICTNMRKGNKFFRKPTRPSLPLRKAPPLISVFSPQGRRGKPLLLVARNRYALRLVDHQRSRQIVRDGTARLLRGRPNAASKPSPYFAGWDRMGIAVYSLQLIVYSLRLISWLFDDKLQISCDFLGGFEEYV